MRQIIIEDSKTNFLSMAFILPFLAVLGIPFYFIWHHTIDLHYEILIIKSNLLFAFFILLSFILIHELLHALAYIVLTKGDYKNISFGFKWKSLSPYCHYSKAVSVGQYRIALLTPALLTGVLPLVYAFFTGDFKVFVFGLFFLLGAMGDISIFWLIRNEKTKTVLKDHPDEIGCIILDSK